MAAAGDSRVAPDRQLRPWRFRPSAGAVRMSHNSRFVRGCRQPDTAGEVLRARGGALLASLVPALALAACSARWSDDLLGTFDDFGGPAFTAEEPLLIAAAEAADAPHIYMDLQHDGTDLVSVIFAIDRGKDGTPSDDPAIRLTPDGGQCNPQIMRYYDFPESVAGQPVFSQDVALMEGVSLEELPDLMAVATTAEMLHRGLIQDPEDSRPQNICSRKLWTILVESNEFAGTAGTPNP